ncbi:hypothetical protein TcBrA4_0020620 [Trypanosoma cruzi]|nr:hypothetical protein TcBrA4_0020620 [Trypanosoma cruzi]
MSSSSEGNGVITLHDTEQEVRKKLRKAFSGGGGTLEDMRAEGVNLHADVAYRLIRFFCPDDNLLAEVTSKYSRGEMNSAEVKDSPRMSLCGTSCRGGRRGGLASQMPTWNTSPASAAFFCECRQE